MLHNLKKLTKAKDIDTFASFFSPTISKKLKKEYRRNKKREERQQLLDEVEQIKQMLNKHMQYVPAQPLTDHPVERPPTLSPWKVPIEPIRDVLVPEAPPTPPIPPDPKSSSTAFVSLPHDDEPLVVRKPTAPAVLQKVQLEYEHKPAFSIKPVELEQQRDRLRSITEHKLKPLEKPQKNPKRFTMQQEDLLRQISKLKPAEQRLLAPIPDPEPPKTFIPNAKEFENQKTHLRPVKKRSLTTPDFSFAPPSKVSRKLLNTGVHQFDTVNSSQDEQTF